MTELYMYANELAAGAQDRARGRTSSRRCSKPTETSSSASTSSISSSCCSRWPATRRLATRPRRGCWRLLENPEQWNAAQVRPRQYLDGAVEEILRYGTPVMQFRRTATAISSSAATTSKKADAVVMYYISADRDEDVFTDPDDVRHHSVTEPASRLRRWRTTPLPRREPRSLGDADHVRAAARPGRSLRTERATLRLRSNFIHGLKHLEVLRHPRTSLSRRCRWSGRPPSSSPGSPIRPRTSCQPPGGATPPSVTTLAEGRDEDGRREQVGPHEDGLGGGVVGSRDRWDERQARGKLW